MKSPSKEEKVVDMKAATQQSRGATTWQPSVEATPPPRDGAGAGAAGAGARGPAAVDEFEIWVKEQQDKAKVTMMKSPSEEENVVDMKAASHQSRGATWKLSVEATQPPGDGAGAGAAGAGVGGPAGAGEGMLFKKLPIFYPPTFQEEYSDTSTDAGSKYSPPKRYQKSKLWSIKTRIQAMKDSDRM